jgi:hypothetical protein
MDLQDMDAGLPPKPPTVPEEIDEIIEEEKIDPETQAVLDSEAE